MHVNNGEQKLNTQRFHNKVDCLMLTTDHLYVKLLNKQGPLDKQQRREAGSLCRSGSAIFLMKRKTKCKADRTAKRVILMPKISLLAVRSALHLVYVSPFRSLSRVNALLAIRSEAKTLAQPS